MTLRIIEAEALTSIAPAETIAAARIAFIRHAEGLMVMPPPVQMQFEKANGDLHVKSGYKRDGDLAVVKIASGFYDNPRLGLPVNDGLLVALDTRTGQPIAVIHDHGLLTSWRTAAAGALSAEIGNVPGTPVLGIVGSGSQARLQAEWIARHLNLTSVQIFSRSPDSAALMAEDLRTIGLDASVAPSIQSLCDTCRLIVTCTPASRYVVSVDAVRAGTHIVALGADMTGKQELDPRLFGRAKRVFVDDLEQCAAHGDLSHAIAASLISPDAPILLGDALVKSFDRDNDAISIVDLTGIAALDVAMASLALGHTVNTATV